MKTAHLIEPHDSEYAMACAFAQRIYTEHLSIHIAHFPELLFVLKDDEAIVGCMGLNKTLTFDLFLNDLRVARTLQTYPPNTRTGEQSIFALEGFSAGVPILISLVAEYAYYSGIDKIAYAAIEVSRRAIERLGFPVDECGAVTLEVLAPQDRENYSRWFTTHHPTSCILDTHTAPDIALGMPEHLMRRVSFSGKFAQFMHTHRAQQDQKAVA